MSTKLDTYVSHKTVRAAKIRGIERGEAAAHAGGVRMTMDNGHVVQETRQYAEKHDPRAGGYYVLYVDGYSSWSPAEAFEGGYSRVDEESGEAKDAVELVAKIAHEANRAYCEALGDHSQPSWEEAPEWQRNSAIAGVRFHMNGEHGPEASHENWMREKLDDGWVYGDVKDPEAKTHPCLVPFDQLPVEQQAKDFIFRAIVRVALDEG